MLRWIFAGLLLLPVCFVRAEGRIMAVASATEITMDEEVEVTYTIENASVSSFVPPDFSPFQVTFGPAKSQNYSIINGKISRKVAFTYGLRPSRTGKYIIGAASAQVNEDPIKSNTLSVSVINGTGGAPSQGNRSLPGKTGGSDNWQDKVFVLVTADKQQVWEGEQVILTYSLYYQVGFENVQILKTPSYNGFLLHDFKVGQPPEEVVNYRGNKYYAQLFKKVALFPNQSGSMTLPPIELECTVYEEEKDPVFDDAFFKRTKEKRIILRSNELKINVQPLPSQGRPEDFRGAVGQFSLEAVLDNNNIVTGDGATLKGVIKGKGNLHLVQLPKPIAPPGMDVYDPSVKEEISASTNALSGRKIFEYVLLPASPGDFSISPLQFSYFDPVSGSYQTIRSQPLNLSVKKGEEVVPASTYQKSSGWESFILQAIKIAGYALALAAGILGMVGLIFFYFYRRFIKKQKPMPGTAIATQKQPAQSALIMPDHSNSTLDYGMYKNLEAAFQSGDGSLFYKLLPTAIWEEAKYAGMITGEVYHRETLLTSIKKMGTEEAQVAERLLSHAAMSLYGGGMASSSLQDDKESLEWLIDRLGRK